jgi:molybdopterin molybdotransferase
VRVLLFKKEGEMNKMKLTRNAIDVSVAQKIIASHIQTLQTETVPLTKSVGRRLGTDIFATHNVPHFTKSEMDGYALRAVDIQGASADHPIFLQVNQTIPCGIVPALPVKQGQASRIMTGAPVPSGADTVVMFEMTEEQKQENDAVTVLAILKEVPKGSNVSEIGEEIREHDFLMERGRRIQAGEIALLATFGFHRIPVYRKPRVAIFTTGSELLSVDQPLEIGKIRNSNLYMLYSLVKEAGGEVITMETIPDHVDQARELIYQTIEKADLIITSGGVSVGDYDIMAQLFDRWKGELLFNKLKMRPGSVTSVGILDRKFVFGLSGNPGACFVGFELFVRPVINGMQGKENPFLEPFTAHLSGDYRKENAYTRFVRGKTFIHDGKVYVKQIGKDRSSITLSIKDADCLIVIPPGNGVYDGELVTALRLYETK